MYDSCGFNVCQRMSADALHEANEIDGRESWRELAIWLWEVHNDINIQKGISATKNGNEMSMEKFVNTNDFIWPSQGECPECRRVDNDSVEASQRLVDVTARHKRQIEQMAKERVCAFIVSEVVFCFSFKRVCVMFCSVRIIYCHTQVCHFQAVLSVSGCSCVFSSLCRTCAASKLLRQE
mmetsp:Transcript_7039/g.9037  ORF Transcript_7039/g.9037 Transcript_7039/m.9037 type:complete len:180 (+) Transcript_7039:530-1069(+)